MKRCVVLMTVLAFFFAAPLSLALAGDEKGPEKITIQPTAEKPKKSPVEFPHRKHQERIKCEECHHIMGDDGKQVLYKEGMKIEKKCADCHNAKVLKGRTKDVGGKKPLKLDTLKGAGHGNCLSCHKETAKKDPEKKKLKKCSTCHPKKKK